MNTIILRDGSRMDLGDVEFVDRYVDGDGVINRLYKSREGYTYKLYKRYPVAGEVVVFPTKEEIKKFALEKHWSAEGYLWLTGEVKPLTEDDIDRFGKPLSVNGYIFKFKNGCVATVWEDYDTEDDTEDDQGTVILNRYTRYNDSDKWNFVCFGEKNKSELYKDDLYKETFAMVKAGYLLSEKTPKDEDTDW